MTNSIDLTLYPAVERREVLANRLNGINDLLIAVSTMADRGYSVSKTTLEILSDVMQDIIAELPDLAPCEKQDLLNDIFERLSTIDQVQLLSFAIKLDKGKQEDENTE